MSEPDISLFMTKVGKRGAGKWQLFVSRLQPNCPVVVDGLKSTDAAATNPLRHAIRQSGKEVRLRTHDGVVWACWVAEEDE